MALIPDNAAELVRAGYSVFVERGAGEAAGYGDGEYERAGAVCVPKAEALGKARLILKVKAPLEEEYGDYGKDHILFTYLHFDENIPADDIKRLIRGGFLGIAYEWVGADGRYPLLTPMSRITGYLFAQKAVELTTAHRRFFCSGLDADVPGCRALIIGLGTIGMSVYRYCQANRIAVTLLDKHPETVEERLSARFGSCCRVDSEMTEVIPFDTAAPQKAVAELDERMGGFDLVFNCAVRRADLPKSKLEYLITDKMIRRMQPGAVVCDTTACDRDLIETCVSNPDLEHYDTIHGVLHYNTDHIPSMVARSSSKMLNDATMPFIRKLAANGRAAVLEDHQLEAGVSCCDGILTHGIRCR